MQKEEGKGVWGKNTIYLSNRGKGKKRSKQPESVLFAWGRKRALTLWLHALHKEPNIYPVVFWK